MVGRRLPLLKTASGLTWLAFCPENERQELIEMLASRSGEEFQLAREPLKLNAILTRARKDGFGQNFRGWDQEEKNRFYRRPHPQRTAGDRLPEFGVYGQRHDHRTGRGKHLPALQKVAKQIEDGVESQEILVAGR